MHFDREEIIRETLSGRLVTFDDATVWRLGEKLSEKPWEGSVDDDQKVIDPYEAHAVYECEQVTGEQPGKRAIIKVRIEVPELLDPDEAPADRAKHALGMQLGWNTRNEIEQLQRLTKAGSKVTPKLLAIRIEQQDETLMWEKCDESQYDVRWWMPGGYVVYILMEKLPALGLTQQIFWDLKFSERQDIRASFRKELMQLQAQGYFHEDRRIDNLMWNKEKKQCYFIDLEDLDYSPDRTEEWIDANYSMWGLRSYWEPHW